MPFVDHDLAHPPATLEAKTNKLKRLVQKPNSFFMDVRCQGCLQITPVFSHATSVVFCLGCSDPLCHPTGGKVRLVENSSFRKKAD